MKCNELKYQKKISGKKRWKCQGETNLRGGDGDKWREENCQGSECQRGRAGPPGSVPPSLHSLLPGSLSHFLAPLSFILPFPPSLPILPSLPSYHPLLLTLLPVPFALSSLPPLPSFQSTFSVLTPKGQWQTRSQNFSHIKQESALAHPHAPAAVRPQLPYLRPSHQLPSPSRWAVITQSCVRMSLNQWHSNIPSSSQNPFVLPCLNW